MHEFLSQWILTLLIALPVLGAIVVGLYRREDDAQAEADGIRRLSMIFAVMTLLLTVVGLQLYFQAVDNRGGSVWQQGEYALVNNFSWISDTPSAVEGAGPVTGYVDIRYHVGIDGLSVWLVVLSAGMLPLCVWGSFTAIRDRVREYYVLLLLLEAGMIGVFCARDLLLFYIFFEFTLVPLYFLIGIWGGAQRRKAAAKFFIYTFAGSVLTFAGVLYLAYQAYLAPAWAGGGVFTFDLERLYALDLSFNVQWWLFLAFFAGFAVKVPLFPFHTWLPLAHTEAPTAGSVLLAGVLLKLGTYGFLRLTLPMLPDAAVALAPYMAGLAIVGIIYAALVAWVQDDFKKLIAYSSVSHLGFCILGMFSLKPAGLSGSVVYMINHGLSTGALFFMIGMIYERYHTRRFADVGGLARQMPWLAFFMVFFTLSSIGLPGLNGFVGEFLVLLGTFTSHTMQGSPIGPLGVPYGIIAAIGILLGAIYMLYMVGRILYGPLKEPPHTPDHSAGLTTDLTPREIGILTPIALCCLLIGVLPNLLIDSIQPAAEQQVLARVFTPDPDHNFDVVEAAVADREAPPAVAFDSLEMSERNNEWMDVLRDEALVTAAMKDARAITAGEVSP